MRLGEESGRKLEEKEREDKKGRSEERQGQRLEK